ncbi:hypothetical protein [Polaromonas sp.]|jgi:hypothetical protein|uniref:hypothetical protein n=1 Tax=Polaromonas sp. TaxID=1869339 RepID=UPI0037CAFBF3
MSRLLHHLYVIVSATVLALGPSVRAQDAASDQKVLPRSQSKDSAAESHTPKAARDPAEPDHIRGQVTRVEGSSITVKTSDGKTLRIGLKDDTTVISLVKGSFAEVDFGTYVGAVAVKLEEYSPIVRDSAVWLHKGFELRIIDEQLRGIALGHKKWDLTPESIISHGWVDDIEVRVLSIKWGPTDYDETDVEIPRDVPVSRMSLGDRSLIKTGARVFVGGQKGADGQYVALFVFVGKDGMVPVL